MSHCLEMTENELMFVGFSY